MRHLISHSAISAAAIALVLTHCDVQTPSGSGSLRVTASTTGTHPDADGYQVRVDQTSDGADRRVDVNGSVILPALPTGSHVVRLLDIAPNCIVNGVNPQPVTIEANRVADAAFQIQCAEPPPGAMRVVAVTAGPLIDPNGYTVSLKSPQGQYGGHVAANDSTTFGDLPTGRYHVGLGGLAPGCTLPEGAGGRTVDVASAATTRVSFQITCNAGTVEVTTIGGGSPPGYPGGYTVTLDGGHDQHIGPNATIRFTLVPVGSHTVAVSGVPHWCGAPANPPALLGPVLPQTVTVQAAGVTRVVFRILCLG